MLTCARLCPCLHSQFDDVDAISTHFHPGHDIDHPGVNNDFLTKTNDPIALLYNDHSVLENAHCASLFFLMRTRPEANLCKNLTSDEYDNFRKVVLEAVLSTDMAGHFAQITELSAKLMTAVSTGEDVEAAIAEGQATSAAAAASSKVAEGAAVPEPASITVDEYKEANEMAEPAAGAADGVGAATPSDVAFPSLGVGGGGGGDSDIEDDEEDAPSAPPAISNAEMQLLLARLLIKAADLSHVQQPYDEAAIWDANIHKEFYEQGDLEIKLGFSPAPLFLRDKNDPNKSDHWFYENMALYETLLHRHFYNSRAPCLS